jgi:hypothetical protein
MSKRGWEGPTLVSNKRPVVRPATGFKRRRDDYEEFDCKRERFEAPGLVGHKRSADFDQEVAQMHKRMKATVPTAEETMAFILPFLLKLRRMYTKSHSDADTMRQQCETLEKHLGTMQSAYHNLMAQNKNLKRELEMSKYRLMLKDRENPNYV